MALSLTADHIGVEPRGVEAGLADEATRLAPAVAFADGVFTLVIAFVMTAAPVVAHTVHPALGIGSSLVLGGLCAWRMPQVSVVAVIVALLFQNLFISFIADQVVTDDDFNFIRGYNFILLSVTWLVIVATFLLNWRNRPQAIDPFIKVSLAVFAVAGVYFLVGFALYSTAAIVYLRNIVTPLLLFHICMLTFAQRPVRLDGPVTTLAWLLAAVAIYETVDRTGWLDLTNGYAYWEHAVQPNYVTMNYDKVVEETGRVWTGLLDSFTINLFNSPLLADYGIVVMRMFGPNMHAISFAYALSFMSIFSLYRGKFLIAAVLVVLLVLSSAKGPLILFLLVGASWIVSRVFGMRFAFLCHCLVLLVYAVAGVVTGLGIGDFHVLGLMAGIHEAMIFPIGRGIGAGGNLSSEFAKIDWSAAQALGRTQFAVESSIGVLLYQIGVFVTVIVGAYAWISWRLVLIAEKTGNNLHAAAALALITMVASGLFQEEAYFSPLALGSFMALSGMIVGASARTGLLR